MALQEDIKWLQEGLVELGGHWDITRYSQVEHGFTVWGPPDGRYHERAEGRSWEAMKVPQPLFSPSSPIVSPAPLNLDCSKLDLTGVSCFQELFAEYLESPEVTQTLEQESAAAWAVCVSASAVVLSMMASIFIM